MKTFMLLQHLIGLRLTLTFNTSNTPDNSRPISPTGSIGSEDSSETIRAYTGPEGNIIYAILN